MASGWPVACHIATPRPMISSGKTTQVSHSFAVVICSGRGNRWNSCMLTGQSTGQPPCVSSSPAKNPCSASWQAPGAKPALVYPEGTSLKSARSAGNDGLAHHPTGRSKAGFALEQIQSTYSAAKIVQCAVFLGKTALGSLNSLYSNSEFALATCSIAKEHDRGLVGPHWECARGLVSTRNKLQLNSG